MTTSRKTLIERAKKYHSNPRPTARTTDIHYVYLGDPMDRFNKPPRIHTVIEVREQPFEYLNTTVYPDTYKLDAGIPFVVETKHDDGSGGIHLVFAHSSGDALKCISSSTLVSAKIIPCTIDVVVPKPKE